VVADRLKILRFSHTLQYFAFHDITNITMETHTCRSIILLFIFIYFFFILGKFLTFPEEGPNDHKKIPVELFVMSRCPDAIACEEVMADVGV
jgi:hypothetical protein